MAEYPGETERFEVEAKFPTSGTENDRVADALTGMDFITAGESEQQDTFLPVDSADENRRIRFETIDGETTILYTRKYNVVPGDIATRKEEERPLLLDEAMDMIREAGAAGSRAKPVVTLTKRRREYAGRRGEYDTKVCLDVVDCGGELLHFMEVEVLVDDPGQVAAANVAVDEFAAELLGGQRAREKRSHRDMAFARLGLA